MKSNPHRETIIHCDKIIVGSSLEALTTAYKYNIPVFGHDNHKPLPYSYLSPNLDLSPLDFENKIEEFRYLSGKTEKRGMQRLELWNHMFYRLNLLGLAPFWGATNDFVDKIPESHKHKHISLQSNGKLIKVTFDKLILFDYPKYEAGKRYFHVNDYIDINTVCDFPANLYMSQDCDYMATLCYETVFFKRNAKMHSCCVKSIIHEDNIDDWNYSQTSVRMKTESDIFWNISKSIRIKTGIRERSPLLTRISEKMEDIIHYDCMDEEIYD